MGLLYPCFATRAEIAAAADPAKTDPDGAPLYPGLWRGASADAVSARMAAGEAPALRLDMDGALKALARKRGDVPLTFTEVGEDGTRQTIDAEPQRWGDAVIVRKEVPASYHLSVVVDDARQGVTHVTRGQDLFAATDLAAASAGASRSAGARLFASSGDPLGRWAETFEIKSGYGFARLAGRGRDGGRIFAGSLDLPDRAAAPIRNFSRFIYFACLRRAGYAT